MYKIIGADNTEYGPVGADKIREWIKEGRVNGQTKIQSEAGEWKPLAEYSEFNNLLPAATGGAPPVLPATHGESGKTSKLAIASLVLGILGWFTLGVTALVGLVLGIVALVKINKSRGALRGTGFAIAGTVISGVFVLIVPILAAMLLPALAQAKAKAQTVMCMNNLKQLGLGGLMYSSDNKDQFPASENWCDSIAKYVVNAKTFQCPGGDPKRRCHYAFNANLAGVDTKKVSVPAETVLFFEADGGWNVSGGPELVLKRTRHRNGLGVVFADGHCEVMKEPRFRNLKWEP
jgi:prepilin-type processing-associated H-X9-DG protein